MSDNTIKMNRRTLLKGLAAIPIIGVASYHVSASAEMLSVDDPIAKNLAYTETSPNPDQTCANCRLYTGGSAPTGGCIKPMSGIGVGQFP